MTAVDDAARMLTLVPWLLERPGATIDEAATAMRATPQQIDGDLSRLDFCGLPGLGGGDLIEVHRYGDRIVLRLADELRRPLRPTLGEAVRLVLAAETVIAAASPTPALTSALAKVRAAAGLADDTVQSVADPSPWLSQVRDVLDGGTCVELDYQGRNDEAPRTRLVDPWRLELHDGNWYLHARDLEADAGRVFRLDRVSGIVATDQPRGPVPAELPTPSYEPEDEQVVELRVSREGRWVVHVLDNVREEPDGDGHRLVFGTDSLRHVADLVMRAAGGAVVLAPDALRQMVADRANAALATYEATASDG